MLLHYMKIFLRILMMMNTRVEMKKNTFPNCGVMRLSIEPVSKNELLTTFISAYKKSITSHLYDSTTKIIFKSKLRQPSILWNEEANDFIKNHNLLAYPHQKSNEIFDKIGGFVHVNEYSFYDTISSVDESDMYVF